MNKISKRTIGRLSFEFIIIVIGVLTAFGVQEFSQSLSDSKRKVRYLISVKLELTENQKKLDRIIEGNEKQDVATDSLLYYLNNRLSTDSTNLFQHFLVYGYLTFKLGAYEALKNSSSYDKLDNIELTKQLNNVIAQAESTLEFQRQIEILNAELFVLKNNDLVDPVNKKVLSDKVHTTEYINNVKQIQGFRRVLTDEFRLIRNGIVEVVKLIDQELE